MLRQLKKIFLCNIENYNFLLNNYAKLNKIWVQFQVILRNLTKI